MAPIMYLIINFLTFDYIFNSLLLKKNFTWLFQHFYFNETPVWSFILVFLL